MAFQVLSCTPASYLLQAIQKHTNRDSKFPFYFRLQHPSIQCGISFCCSSLFPPQLNSQLFFFNQYKSVYCKCYKTWIMSLSVQKQRCRFLPTTLSSASFASRNKWVEFSRGYLKGYVKEISREGSKSGITGFASKDLFQRVFVHILSVSFNNWFSVMSEPFTASQEGVWCAHRPRV